MVSLCLILGLFIGSYLSQLPLVEIIYIAPGNTWASSTQVIFFSKIFFLKENNESDKMFGHISFVEMKFSQLIN
jgi:hypothetical protein